MSLPLLSKAIKIKNLKKISTIQNKSIELSLLLSVPASLGLILASHEIINALFGYGSFSEKDINLTAQGLKFFGYGIPAFALIKVLSNLFFARDNTKTPFYLSLFVVLINIFVSLTYFKTIGFIIIPIATSLSTWLGVIAYYVLLRNNQILRFEKQTIKNIIKIIFSTLLMSTILIYGLDYFEESMNYLNKYKSIYLIFIVSFVGTIYLISCYLLGVLKLKNYKTN